MRKPILPVKPVIDKRQGPTRAERQTENGARPLRPFRHGLLCALALTVCLSTPAKAERPWEITADRITRFEKPDIIVAEGNVILRPAHNSAGEEMVIKADWIRYDVILGQAKARGNLRLETATEQAVGDMARLDLNSRTGTLSPGTLAFAHQDYTIRISGHEIRKTGEATYEIKQSRITTCPAQPGKDLPWTVESTDVRVKKDGMAVLKPATLLIKEIPALYTPYLAFPVKTKRESGFLMPELSTGRRDGFGLITPYFLNISPSTDATLYPGYLANRGLYTGAEFRYVAGLRSKGILGFTYLNDDKEENSGDDFNSDGVLRTTENRYWLRGKADHDFGNRLTAKLDLDFVSDQDFLEEFAKGVNDFDASDKRAKDMFNRGFQEESVRQRNSTLLLTKSWDASVLTGSLAVVQDVAEPAVATSSAQTLPRIQYNGRYPFEGTRLSATWDTEYINYWRENGIGFHRVDLHPRLIWSLPRSIFEGNISAGVRETGYQVEANGDSSLFHWDHARNQSRTMQDYGITVASPWLRDFDLHLGDISTLSHTLRPQATYSYIPTVDQRTLPSIDGTDRIDAQNQVAYAWNNYFKVTETTPAGESRQRDFGSINLKQTYDILEARRDLTSAGDLRHPFSDVLLEFNVSPWQNLHLGYDSAWSVYNRGNTYYQFDGGYAVDEDNLLTTTYTYQKNPAVREPFFYTDAAAESEKKLTLALHSALTTTISVQAAVDQRWATNDNHIDESVQLTYRPSCWGVAMLLSNTDDDRRFALTFSLTGIGNLAGLGFNQDNGINYDLF